MKKLLLLISAITLSVTGFSQLDSIKNPNFNNWSGGKPVGWTTVNASQATGPNALMLATTSVTGTATTSARYRMRPLSMTYVAKYTNGSDAPLITVTLTKTVGATTYTVGSGSSTGAGAGSYSDQSITINYPVAYHAFAPDKITISLASSGATPAVGSTLYVDSLVLVQNCTLNPTITPTSGNNPVSIPASGDTVSGAVAGQPFNFTITNYIPDTAKLNIPFGNSSFPVTSIIDTLQSGTWELSGSAANFMSVDTNSTTQNSVGGNSISCLSFSGTIPASHANATYILIVTPLLWASSTVAPLHNFPSPQTTTIYIKVGSGGDTITSTDNIYWGSMNFHDTTRLYNVYVPSKYWTSHTRVPLIFNIHGWTGSPTKQMDFENFRPVADTANFIVVQPLATGTVPSWISGPGTSDTDYLFALMDSIEKKYNIDTDRVYVTGFSEGGMMSYTFACYYSDRIAALASVAGGIQSYTGCTPTHYMPVMETHGTNDPLATYKTNVQTLLNYWVGVNKIDTVAHPVVRTTLPHISHPNDSTSVQLWKYNGGQCGATVQHYKIINGGHECPTLNVNAKNNYGLNARNNDYEATVAMWNFLSQYRLSQLCLINPPNGINEITSSGTCSVYPNPSNGSFTLNLTNYENAKIKIMDVLGKTVLEATINAQYTPIDLSNAAKGIYIYKVQDQSGATIKSGKLVVQ